MPGSEPGIFFCPHYALCVDNNYAMCVDAPHRNTNEGKMKMTKGLTLGTASLTRTADGMYVANWMDTGSFLKGEQMFGNINGALRFLRLKGLPIIATIGF